jgi:hypothetical protein
VDTRVREREGGSNSVVESQPSKLLVAGSIPVSRSIRLRSPKASYGGMVPSEAAKRRRRTSLRSRELREPGEGCPAEAPKERKRTG